MSNKYIVVARSDGRGGIHPFGSYGPKQASAKVTIGERQYTVTKDGRVNIPKSVMDRGVKGSDGRMRISIQFASMKGKEGWKDIKSIVSKPLKSDKNKSSGDKATPKRRKTKAKDDIVPIDDGGANWNT